MGWTLEQLEIYNNRYLNTNATASIKGIQLNEFNNQLLNYLNDVSGSTGGGTWGSITGTLSDQIDLQNALDTKTTEDWVSGFTYNKAYIDNIGGGGGTWGSITGTLSDQIDLQNALDLKLDISDFDIYTGQTQQILNTHWINIVDNANGIIALEDDLHNNYWTSGQTQSAIDDAVSGITLDGYYTSGQTDALLEGKVDVSTMDNYWTSGQTQSAIDDATSGLTTSLSGLTDTNISNPVNDQVLIYVNGEWVNETTSLSNTLSGLTDVDVSTVVQEDFLMYSGDTWTNTRAEDIAQNLTEGQLLQYSGDTIIGYSPPSGSTITATWGNIQGTLSNQGDLQLELDNKVNTSDSFTTTDNKINSSDDNIVIEVSGTSSSYISYHTINKSAAYHASERTDLGYKATVGTDASVNEGFIQVHVNGLVENSFSVGANASGTLKPINYLGGLGLLTDSSLVTKYYVDTALDNKVDISIFDTYTGTTNSALDNKVELTVFDTYTGTTNSALDNKVELTVFDTFTGTTNDNLDTKVDVSVFDTYTGTTNDALDNKVELTVFDTYTGTTNDTLDNKVDKNTSITAKSTNYTLTASDNNSIIECTGTITITLPNTIGLDSGARVDIINMGTGTITLAATTTLYTKDSLTDITSQYGGVSAYHKGGGIWVVVGDLS